MATAIVHPAAEIQVVFEIVQCFFRHLERVLVHGLDLGKQTIWVAYKEVLLLFRVVKRCFQILCVHFADFGLLYSR